MSTRTDLLKLLSENTGVYLSGQKIGEELQVSRNAVWKAMQQLKNEGYHIESKPSTGYRLRSKSNIITEDAIAGSLRFPCDIHILDTVSSTNNVAKEISLTDKPALIIANKQTGGRGRLGRSFASPAGTGLYMTIALHPDFDLDKALYVTMAAAVAVCRAIDSIVGVKAKIKWVNDVFYQNKKICGILTEAQTNFENGKIDRLVIGIGVNCFPGSFPEELENIAGCLSRTKNSFFRGDLAAEIYNQLLDILTKDLSAKTFLREYRTRCFILGKNIIVHPNLSEKGIRAKAIDIDENGGLVVEYLEGRKNRQMETLTTGEVSIKIQ
ncbi:biotin--[acetyl-CoA-carboxylase] ligase [Ihubacter sp. mB4P-1]|uniref:biotin--[acetyl-CoA-carboxylase] ligase n=1 Tax=Ihubacter sp. mB4P-1 TaxID=3242370 RepID=UPI003C7D29BF